MSLIWRFYCHHREEKGERNEEQSNLALHVAAVQSHQTAETGIFYKRLVVHQLSGGKRCHGIKETSGSPAKVSDGHGVETFVGLEPVPAVPVPALLHQPAGIT